MKKRLKNAGFRSLIFCFHFLTLLKKSLQMMPVVETPEEEMACDDTPGATSTSTGTPSSSATEVLARLYLNHIKMH